MWMFKQMRWHAFEDDRMKSTNNALRLIEAVLQNKDLLGLDRDDPLLDEAARANASLRDRSDRPRAQSKSIDPQDSSRHSRTRAASTPASTGKTKTDTALELAEKLCDPSIAMSSEMYRAMKALGAHAPDMSLPEMVSPLGRSKLVHRLLVPVWEEASAKALKVPSQVQGQVLAAFIAGCPEIDKYPPSRFGESLPEAQRNALAQGYVDWVRSRAPALGRHEGVEAISLLRALTAAVKLAGAQNNHARLCEAAFLLSDAIQQDVEALAQLRQQGGVKELETLRVTLSLPSMYIGLFAATGQEREQARRAKELAQRLTTSSGDLYSCAMLAKVRL